MVSWHQYAAAWAVQYGGYDIRRAPAAAREWQRLSYGLARFLSLLRIRPAGVSLAGLGLAAAVPLAVGAGGAPTSAARLLMAAGLVLLSALAGTVARALGVLTNRVGARAALQGAVADRLGEVAWLVGFWLVGVPGLLVALAAGATVAQEYVREQARAAGLSLVGAQTVGQRPARVVVAVVGPALAGLVAMVGEPVGAGAATAGVLIVATAGWLLLALIGLGQLAAAIRHALR